MPKHAIRSLLESPLSKALAGDVAMMGGIEILKAALRANKEAMLLKGLQDKTDPGNTQPPPPSLNLRQALMGLATADEIREVTTWMSTLQNAHRAELSKWDLSQLQALFKHPAEVRTQLIVALTGSTVQDEVAKLKQWIVDNLPTLDSESKDIIREWEKWADDILKD